jgi:hypothetical protein
MRAAESARGITRRSALGSVGSVVAQTIGAAQGARSNTGLRPVPRDQLVNVLEYEEQAKRVLEAGAYAAIAGGDRSAFERITLRPRMMVPVLDLNLGVTLFGHASTRSAAARSCSPTAAIGAEPTSSKRSRSARRRCSLAGR